MGYFRVFPFSVSLRINGEVSMNIEYMELLTLPCGHERIVDIAANPETDGYEDDNHTWCDDIECYDKMERLIT